MSFGTSMSFLKRVSKRPKGDATSDDVAGIHDSLHQPSDVQVAAADTSERVWSIHDFSIFHEIQKPIVVVSPGLYQTHHDRCSKSKSSALVLFHNTTCLRRFGIPRAHSACCALVSSLADEDRDTWNAWEAEILQERKVFRSRVDVYALFKPLFQAVAKDKPDCLVRVESKAITVQTALGDVQTAVMHIAEMDASTEDLRVTAMHLRSPIHTLMFNSRGELLGANSTALKACHMHTPGAAVQTFTMKMLFNMGSYPGGEPEAQSLYEDALNAVLKLQLTWRHMQPHCSRRDGKPKWSMIEMWPMHDPVDASPAVLVKRYNMTQHKELEMQLATQQDDLLRQNEDLEQESAAMQEEKARLQQEADKLAEKLQTVLSEKFVRRGTFDAETPIDKTLGYLQSVISGNTPSPQQALELHSILTQSDTKLRQPVELEEQLLRGHMGSDVAQSMLSMLQGNGTVPHTLAPPMSATHAEAAVMTLESFVPASVVPEVERLLKTAESSWQFDVFAFAEATPGHTLSLLFFHLVKRSGILQLMNFDESKLCCYLYKMDAGYDPSTPYHNSIHVASVVQMTHMLMCHGGIMAWMQSRSMDKGSIWATYAAALVHDFEHSGLNNDFLIKTAHPLAITYSDDSPLEHHHLAAATRLFFDPECMYVLPQSMNADELRTTKTHLFAQVLGTDMKKHFDILSRFQAAFKVPSGKPLGTSSPKESLSQSLDWDSIKVEDKTLVHQVVLKCADIGHLAADHRTHRQWSYKLEEEFFRQGDKERALGLPISPLMDRDQPGAMTRSQMGFFSIVGIPLFQALAGLFKDAQPMLDGALDNFRHWEAAANAQAQQQK